MKKVMWLGMLLLVLTAIDASAQFRKKTTPGTGGNPTATDSTKPKPTPRPPGGGTGGNPQPTKEVRTREELSSPNEFGVPVKPSLRPQYGFDDKNTQVSERRALAYEHLRADDIVFSHFIWREIDAREKMNKVFSYPGKSNEGDQRFFGVLLEALKDTSNHIIAFSADDDRFTTPLTFDSLMGKISPLGTSMDTNYVRNVNYTDIEVYDTIIAPKANAIAPKPDSIYTFRILEQVMFDKESSRLFTRILGIAPVGKIKLKPELPVESKTLFWVYYPDLRDYLSKKYVYNGKNISGRMTWEDLFENRMFSSYIVKSSMDNPTDARLADLIKDPLFRLLEGENIKEKIFNYEQNLWAY
jgi:gliding motility associated protien GldN